MIEDTSALKIEILTDGVSVHLTECRTTSVSEVNFPGEQLTSPPELSDFASGFRSFAAVTALLMKERSSVDPQLAIRTHIFDQHH
jgi:hypothetical protein